MRVQLAASMGALVHDVRFAARALLARPWQLAATAGTLTFAVALATAMFVIVDALVFRPAPFRDPGQLAYVTLPGRRIPATVLQEWKRSPVFANVSIAISDDALLQTDAGYCLRKMAKVTPDVFALLGDVHPVRGRLFDSVEGRSDRDDEVLIGEEVWQTLYGTDPHIVGRTVIIDGKSMVVIGVLPAEFHFPAWNTALWAVRNPATTPASTGAYVRFADSVPRLDALREAARLAAGAAQARADRAIAKPIAGGLDQFYRGALKFLLGGLAILFVVLCANVSGLRLLGLLARRHELGTRAALGATPARIMRGEVIESVLLGAIAAVGGLMFAWVLVAAGRAVLPSAAFIRSLKPLSIDLRAVLFAAAAACVATCSASALPAVISSRVHAGRWLQGGDGGSRHTPSIGAATRVLVIGQVAFSFALLLGATLLTRSFVNLLSQDRGLDAVGVMVADVELSDTLHSSDAKRAAAYRVMEDAVRALPGVTGVAWTYGTPPDGGGSLEGEWSSNAPSARTIRMHANYFFVGREFFRLYGVPILRGRPFEPTDDRTKALVSERFVQRLWPDGDPIGRQFRYADASNKFEYTVIGVVRELHYPTTDVRRDAPQFYVPFAPEHAFRSMLNLRCGSGCPGAAVLWRRLAEAEAGVQVISVRPVESDYASQFVRPRAAVALSGLFGVVSLLAAGTSLFCMVSSSVTRRRREFAIHAALGASPSRVRWLVWREGLASVLPGAVLGCLTGAWLSRTLASLLFGVSVQDPANWLVVISVLMIAAIAALWTPVRLATHAAPAVLLRQE